MHLLNCFFNDNEHNLVLQRRTRVVIDTMQNMLKKFYDILDNR